MDLYVVQIQQESFRYETYFTISWGISRRRRTISRKSARRRTGRISKSRKIREHPKFPELRSGVFYMKCKFK